MRNEMKWNYEEADVEFQEVFLFNHFFTLFLQQITEKF